VPGRVSDLKINLGSGEKPLPGFVNVDALADAPGVDVVADISETLPFDDGSASLVYAAHILEHFPHAEVPRLLREWRRVLRDGGQLLIAVPNLDVIAQMLTERRGWFTPPHDPWIGAIYGGQKDEYDFHKGGFTAVSLAHRLHEADFGAVRQESRFHDIGEDDGSISPLPFGANVSLNMRAVAGGEPLPGELLVSTGVDRAFERLDRVFYRCLDVSTSLRAHAMNRRRRRLENIIG
jgi:predicted SAM-dependent methyltransferase